MSIETTLLTLNKELAKAESTASVLRASIKALGGTITGPVKPTKRRSRGGWPKGRKRGSKSASDAPNGNGTSENASASSSTAKPGSPIATARAKRAGASLTEAAS